MTAVLAILNALAAIPSILKYVEAFAAACAQWYIERQQQETLKEIADAAALAARAKTEAERYAATDAWHRVFARSRVTK